MRFLLFFCLFLSALSSAPKIELGVDVFFKDELFDLVKGKRIGIITNHTGVDRDLCSTVELFKKSAKEQGYTLSALFAPEHGFEGEVYAGKKVEHKKRGGIPIFSLHGKTRRPTEEMLKKIDVLIYDVQDIGCRTYTYTTTLFYAMEEASKAGVKIIVLDRPNPINGLTIDGPMLQEAHRSFLGYINIPYCHGMTIGELAHYFNQEYDIGCDLEIVSMRGWSRSMSFEETGLAWVPTSPNIPEADTPLYCATTGILGELGIVSIGIGYTLPFKVVGAPWIDAQVFAEKLNAQKFPGVRFHPFHFRPFDGIFKGSDCHGIYIIVTNKSHYRPLAVQYLLIGMLKTLYPEEVEKSLKQINAERKRLFSLANGNGDMFESIRNERYIVWKLINYDKEERKQFSLLRKKYLLY